VIKNILISLIFLSTLGGFAQQKLHRTLLLDTSYVKVKKFNQDHLKAYKNKKVFNYSEKKKEPSTFEIVYNWLARLFIKFLTWIFGVEKATGILRTIFTILPYFILLLCLFVIFKFFIKINLDSFSKKRINKSGEVLIFDDEKLIQSDDLDKLLAKAIADNNFRLAIRYEYLKILKHLSMLKLIDWQLQKTNDDYYAELKQVELKPMFKQSTLLYDYVWYGNFKINQNHYAKIRIILDEFLTKMNRFEQTK